MVSKIEEIMKKSRTVLFLALLFSLALPSLLQAAEKPLRFGVFPYKSPKEMMKLFMPIARQLEKEIGRPIHLSSAPNAEQYNQRAIAGEYDLIWPCNTCYFQIHDQAGFEAVASGSPTFHGIVIVRKNSGITQLSQLKGKKIAAAWKNSYAAYKFLAFKMKKLGYSPPEDFSVSFLGKLDSIIFSVVGKHHAAGVVRQDALASSRFDRVRDQLSVIYTSPEVPQFPFAVKPDMDQKQIDQIVKVLTEINDKTSHGKSILNALKVKEIIPCTDSNYDEFRTIIRKHK